MSTCGFDGTAIVGIRLLQPVTWILAEDRIHVAGEIIHDPDASAFFATRYVVGEWCSEVHAYHATFKEEDQ